jgi:hypothetical protein
MGNSHRRELLSSRAIHSMLSSAFVGSPIIGIFSSCALLGTALAKTPSSASGVIISSTCGCTKLYIRPRL